MKKEQLLRFMKKHGGIKVKRLAYELGMDIDELISQYLFPLRDEGIIRWDKQNGIGSMSIVELV